MQRKQNVNRRFSEGVEVRRLIFITIICIISSGCLPWPVYSRHNLDEGTFSFGGGGYRLVFLEPGVYKIEAMTNEDITLNPKTARKMWRDQAVKVCGSDNYIEKDVYECQCQWGQILT